jgi:hypothetical protein
MAALEESIAAVRGKADGRARKAPKAKKPKKASPKKAAPKKRSKAKSSK